MAFGWHYITSALSGLTGSILFKTNDKGFAGSENLTFNSSSNTLTLTGSLVNNGNLKVVEGQAYSQMYGVTLEDTGSFSINGNNGNSQIFFLNVGNLTASSPTNMQDGAVYNFVFKQDSTGSRGMDFDSNFKFPGGTKPTLSTGSNAVDVISCIYSADVSGGSLLCSAVNNFA